MGQGQQPAQGLPSLCPPAEDGSNTQAVGNQPAQQAGASAELVDGYQLHITGDAMDAVQSPVCASSQVGRPPFDGVYAGSECSLLFVLTGRSGDLPGIRHVLLGSLLVCWTLLICDHALSPLRCTVTNCECCLLCWGNEAHATVSLLFRACRVTVRLLRGNVNAIHTWDEDAGLLASCHHFNTPSHYAAQSIHPHLLLIALHGVGGDTQGCALGQGHLGHAPVGGPPSASQACTD